MADVAVCAELFVQVLVFEEGFLVLVVGGVVVVGILQGGFLVVLFGVEAEPLGLLGLAVCGGDWVCIGLD